MSTKIRIKGTGQEIDMQRGMTIPRQGEAVFIKLKGETEEKLYTVDLVEHFLDMTIPIYATKTIVTLEEVKSVA